MMTPSAEGFLVSFNFDVDLSAHTCSESEGRQNDFAGLTDLLTLFKYY